MTEAIRELNDIFLNHWNKFVELLLGAEFRRNGMLVEYTVLSHWSSVGTVCENAMNDCHVGLAKMSHRDKMSVEQGNHLGNPNFEGIRRFIRYLYAVPTELKCTGARGFYQYSVPNGTTELHAEARVFCQYFVSNGTFHLWKTLK